MTPVSGCLLFSLALHAHHARCHLYHHCLLSLFFLDAFQDHPIPALPRKSVGYFLAVTVLGDVQRAIRQEEAWLLYFPALVVFFFCFSCLCAAIRRERLRALACLAAVAGLHCLFGALYWER